MNCLLGQKLRDRVSGFTGIASIRVDFLTGNIQYTLVPRLDDKKFGGKEAQAFDVHQLEDLGPGHAVIAAPKDTGIRLGQKVKDVVTGFNGIATLKNTFLNGCVYYTVSLEITKDRKEPQEMFLEYKRLTNVGAGVVAAIAKRMDKSPTGGPAHCVTKRG